MKHDEIFVPDWNANYLLVLVQDCVGSRLSTNEKEMKQEKKKGNLLLSCGAEKESISFSPSGVLMFQEDVKKKKAKFY